MKDVTSTLSRTSKYMTALQSENEQTLSVHEALSVLIENRLKRTYQAIRNAKKTNCIPHIRKWQMKKVTLSW